MEKIISRLAPTPSGFLHIGNAVNFVLTWVLTRRAGGKLWLRIDDLDAPRMRPEYLEDIFRTIDWLGLDYDFGPSGPDDHIKSFSQQSRQDTYLAAIEQLRQGGGEIFACVCSRSEIRSNSEAGQYGGTCRNAGIPFIQPETTIRIATPPDAVISWSDHLLGKTSVNLYDQMRDFVVRRKDGIPAYQIASLVDDLRLGVNLIVRGEDLANSTAAQLFLSTFLSENAFSQTQFYHHQLLTDDEGRKLSKSAGAYSLKEMRESGKSTSLVFSLAAQILAQPGGHFLSAVDFLDK